MLQLLRACVSQEEMWAAPVLAQSALSVSEMRMAQTGRTTRIRVECCHGHSHVVFFVRVFFVFLFKTWAWACAVPGACQIDLQSDR